MSFVPLPRFRKLKGRDSLQKKIWEENKAKIIKCIYKKGAAYTHEIVEEVGISRQRVNEHIRELVSEEKIDRRHKGLYEAHTPIYIRKEPKGTIIEFIEKSKIIRASCGFGSSQLSYALSIPTIISKEDINKIIRILKDSIIDKNKKNLRKIPDEMFLIFLIRKNSKEQDIEILQYYNNSPSNKNIRRKK